MGEGGGDGGFQYVFAYFCARALYKISSSYLKWFSSFNNNKKNNRQVRGITANVLQSLVKSHLYIDPKQYSEFHDPSSSIF